MKTVLSLLSSVALFTLCDSPISGQSVTVDISMDVTTPFSTIAADLTVHVIPQTGGRSDSPLEQEPWHSPRPRVLSDPPVTRSAEPQELLQRSFQMAAEYRAREEAQEREQERWEATLREMEQQRQSQETETRHARPAVLQRAEPETAAPAVAAEPPSGSSDATD
jgi:hypothetical protein